MLDKVEHQVLLSDYNYFIVQYVTEDKLSIIEKNHRTTRKSYHNPKLGIIPSNIVFDYSFFFKADVTNFLFKG